MGARERRPLPAWLEAVQRRFERWRRTRKVRSRIPEPLWAAAVRAAGQYGIHRTAKALRVNYYGLKKRVERQAAVADAQQQTALPAGKVPAGWRFLELPASANRCLETAAALGTASWGKTPALDSAAGARPFARTAAMVMA